MLTILEVLESKPSRDVIIRLLKIINVVRLLGLVDSRAITDEHIISWLRVTLDSWRASA
jgi:hypothetical protein